MIYLLDKLTMEVLFEVDLSTTTERALEVEWTERPIEDGATITDYRVRKPETFPLEGVITAWPWLTGYDPGRLQTVDNTIRQLAADGQPVLMVTDIWSEEVVITRVGSVRPEDEDLIRVSLECRMIETVKAESATVPAAKMKASVRPGSAPAQEAKLAATGDLSTKAKRKSLDAGTDQPVADALRDGVRAGGGGSLAGPGIGGGVGL